MADNAAPVNTTPTLQNTPTATINEGASTQAATIAQDATNPATQPTAEAVAGTGGQFDGFDILDSAEDLNQIGTASGMPMRASSVAPTPALNGGLKVDPSIVAHTITKPAAGQTEIVSVQPGELLATKFDPNSADLKLDGKDLVMSFNDGSKVVLDNFAQDSQNLPTISLPNGSLVAGGIIVAQLQGLTNDVFALETAAGASGEGGTFIYSDDFGSVTDLLDKLPPIGFTALTFGAPSPEVFVADDIPFGGTFVPGFNTPSGIFGSVSGGFEDWQPAKNVGNMVEEPMAMQINFTPNSNEVVDQVTVSNIPTGVTFYYGTPGNYVPITVTNGSVTFTGAQLAGGNIFIKQADNIDGDIPLTISLLIRNPVTNQTAILTQNAVAVVDAVADQPILNSTVSIGGGPAVGSGPVTGTEKQLIVLNAKIDFPDQDGSETHTVILSGVPQEWTVVTPINGVTFTAVNNPDGTVTYTATVPNGVNINGSITFDPHNWSSKNGPANITLTARADETVTDGELTTANNTAQISTNFNITINEDVPTLVSSSTPVVIPEHDLTIPGLDQVNGQIVVDYHTDNGAGANLTLSTDGLTALNLTSHGQALTYTLSADGKTITATNPAGETVFTVGLNPGTANGSVVTTTYTFTLVKQLDHPPVNGNNVIDIPVKFIATDSDGDQMSGVVDLRVIDDIPVAQNVIGNVDETNNLNQPLTGALNYNFGADGESVTGSVSANQIFSSEGSQKGGVLSSHGVPVTVTFENGQYIGKAGTTTVFTMTINANGTYTFTQLAVLDHADGNNPNDVIDLKFGYQVKDYDGDTVGATVTIRVSDDAPVAVNDTNFIPNNSTIATGNILSNDILSKDAPNTVQSATVNGTTKSFATPDGTDANGKYVLLTGTYGQLKLYENGQYTYTYNSTQHQGNLTERFDYTIIDGDGDTSSTSNNSGLVITIVDNGPGTPVNVVGTVDETNLGMEIGGTIVVQDAVAYNLAPGFSSGGSQANGALTSHGVPVVVTLVNGQYVGTANGQTVFTLTVNTDGTYKFVQSATLDHADGSNPNDVINLNFTYIAKDSDGDSVQGTITVNVLDDAPVAVNDTNFVPNGSTTATGDILANDIHSKDSPTLVQSATVNGVVKSFATPDGTDIGGKFVLLTGTYGQLKLYENGKYTYTYDTANHQGNLTERFDYTIVDNDGDTSSTGNNSGLVITIVDNGPGVAPNIIGEVDETFLGTQIGGTITVQDAVSYNLSAGFSSSGSQSNGTLTSHGAPVTVALVNGQYVGTANGQTIFTLTLNSNGTYSFVQTGALDHADGNNPNDVINLTFNYQAKDADGDASQGTITVRVLDDAPVAVNDTNFIPNGSTIATGDILANDTLGNDSPTLVQSATVNGTTKSFGTPDGTDAGGKFVILTGTYGQLKLYENGKYTYTYDAANHTGNLTEKFDYTIVDNDGDTSSTGNNSGLVITIVDNGPGTPVQVVGEVDETNLGTQIGGTIVVQDATTYNLSAGFTSGGSQLNGALTSHGVPVTVTLVNGQYIGTANGQPVFTLSLSSNGSYTFIQTGTLDHADGSNPNDVINLTFNYQAKDADGDSVQGTITINVLDDAPVAVNDSNFIPNGSTIATGDILANDILGNDSPTLVQSATVNGTTKSFGTPDGTDAGGKFVILTGTYGQLKLYENGKYTYTYDTANHNGNLTERFDYTIVDNDGDTSSTGNNSGLVITIVDNGPGVAPSIVGEVDETTLGTQIGGTITAPNLVSYELDGTGFTSSGSKANGALTSHGAPVTVALVNGQYVGTANGQTIFTLTLNSNGSYTFVQTGVLDHADGNNPNDVINLTFKYNGVDGAGEKAPGTITIHVLDDAPVAVNDTNFVPNGSTIATGDILANDTLGNDSPTLVQSATVNGTTKSFGTPDGTDAGGKFVLLTGTYGQLKLYENGKYTYTYDAANHQGNLTEKFDYTIVDNDGDTSSTGNNSGLVITITDNGPGTPVQVVGEVDETNLGTSISGTIVVQDATTYELSPGFTSGGSQSNGALTSHGVPVVVSLVNGQYVGTANGQTIFTLTVNSNGSYTFVQTGVLDHADGNNPNDAIDLNFTYTAKDADGDAVQGIITIHVLDDAPVAVADTNSIPDGGVTATGDLVANDQLSNDTPNTLQSVSFNNITKAFTSPDGTDAGGKYVLLNGTYGQIKVYESGKYTYTYDTANHSGNHTEKFTYTLQDSDGDHSSTTLTIDITDTPNAPPSLQVEASSNHDSLFDIHQLVPNLTQMPELTELTNIDCTVEELVVLGNQASNLLALDFPSIITVDIMKNVQQNSKSNGLGAFTLNDDGTISNVQLLFGTTGNTYYNNNTTATYDTLGGGGKVVFFIVKDGFANLKNAGLSGADGNALNPANVSLAMEKQADGSLKLVYFDANGKHYVDNTIYASEKSFNSDGQIHAVAGSNSSLPAGSAQYAFEDAHGAYDYYGSDRDFNDVVFSVSASPFVDVKYNTSHVLFSTFNITDADSANMHEVMITISDAKTTDIVSFDFTGTPYSIVNNNIYKNGVDTGIDATITKGVTGAVDIHLIGDALTADYSALMKAIHFNISGDPFASNGDRHIGIVVTDEHGQSSSTSTIYNVNVQIDPSVITGNGTLNGTSANDIIMGRDADDTLVGGAGHDVLIAGNGHDTLIGGAGADSFMFLKNTTGVDTIMDYHKYEGDRLDISDLLTGSNYAPGISHIEDYVKIDSMTGNVYVDATGHGNFNSANHIATIDNIFTIDAVNILLNDHEGNKVIHTV
jgi:T1SS-143 domain-containing protein